MTKVLLKSANKTTIFIIGHAQTEQGGHCPGSQGKVRESETVLNWSRKSQGI